MNLSLRALLVSALAGASLWLGAPAATAAVRPPCVSLSAVMSVPAGATRFEVFRLTGTGTRVSATEFALTPCPETGWSAVSVLFTRDPQGCLRFFGFAIAQD